MKSETLQAHSPDLYSQIRRQLNGLKQKEAPTRRQASLEFLKLVKEEQLSSSQFDEIMQISNKDLLKALSDHSESTRENCLNAIIELLQRCTRITQFLPYILAALVDRTNCVDLQGIANLPQKMRPAPGQKPKVISKPLQTCEEVRTLYCTLLSKIFSLVEQNEIRDRLDDIVNILRALVMDPSPEIQKIACETLEYFCKNFRLILLHYTEQMGRAVLLPLVSKKSKVRIAGLNALTAILGCGLWKYNAFIFQNLIGFRDPNSVPIKDFYEPSNNINYFATFINDQNSKVRQQFIRHVYIWTCQLDDKYDHHGRLVPYILSGLFDSDEKVKQTSLKTIEEIGRQIEIQKQKQFRQNKQFAVDAAWIWQGLLIDLPVQLPLTKRPSLGSRVFIRGHVRKFWSALYKQIKDISFDNRIRATRLMLYSTIFTQNYMTQYLDVLIPHLLSSVIPMSIEDAPISDIIYKIICYIGRYCDVSAYYHIVASALKGELIQNQNFVKASLKGLAGLIYGCFQSIPNGVGLAHKKEDIIKLISLIDNCSICSEVYNGNADQSMMVANELLNGLKSKANQSQIDQILDAYSISLIKLFAVSYYEQFYSHFYAKQQKDDSKKQFLSLKQQFKTISSIFPTYFDVLDTYMREAYMNPPALMDADWKLIIVIANLLSQSQSPQQLLIFQLGQEVIAESLTLNRSIEILIFLFRYITYLFEQVPQKDKLAQLHLILVRGFQNFCRFKPMKKVPVYDQHLVKPQTDPTVVRINQDVFLPLFSDSSKMIQTFYINKVCIPLPQLGKILHYYITISNKFIRHKDVAFQSIKTLWIIFQRSILNVQSPQKMIIVENQQKTPVFEVIIDFLIQRLQTMGQVDLQKANMIFDSLEKAFECCPKLTTYTEKLLNFYPKYPFLLEKLFKYAMDEKDQGLKEKYYKLLLSLCVKLRPWFQLELRQSNQQRRFARANLLQSILDTVPK